MSRSRVRRPFTVEVKSNGRQSHGLAIPSRVPDPPRPTARLLDEASLWLRAERLPEHVSPAPEAEPRRILPSLLVAEAPEPAPEPPVAKEPPLPRVRRVKARPARAPAADRPEPVVQAALDQPIVVPVPAGPAPEPAQTPRRRNGPKLLPDLARGERWKRRLPRACW
ncbi:DNA-binding protein [Methylobacterium oxalidis]|nr:DNA-binding protein [Methylobacterium oxalidis]GJE31798.1 hypothetical protein LDDCCGHA_1978 [Methylobacterium oxalidis]